MLFLLRGVDVAPEAAAWLSERVGEPTATTLRDALYSARGSIDLGPDDRERILQVIDTDGVIPEALYGLRLLLLVERDERPGPV